MFLIKKFVKILFLMILVDVVFPGHHINWTVDIGIALFSTIFTQPTPRRPCPAEFYFFQKLVLETSLGVISNVTVDMTYCLRTSPI